MSRSHRSRARYLQSICLAVTWFTVFAAFAFDLKDTVGQSQRLTDLKGKWVVVNFWATWCTPCLAEIPDLAALDKARDDVDVIGLAYEEIESPDMEAFLREHPISYPMAVLDVYHPPADFDTPPGLPMTYLIAPDGKVAKQFLGPTDAKELAQLIKAAGSGD